MACLDGTEFHRPIAEILDAEVGYRAGVIGNERGDPVSYIVDRVRKL